MQKAVKPLGLAFSHMHRLDSGKGYDAVVNTKNARLGKPGIFNFSRCKGHHWHTNALLCILQYAAIMPIVTPKLMAKLTPNGLADWPVAHLNPQI
ncbi:hypothetical protein QP175_08610 [Sphingomonas aerolata]|uniref:hypothetical protein n=1 Tax=Sphingomonas aerolata TaxID=185951 RepID=UPI002FE2E487